jgi:putative transposase
MRDACQSISAAKKKFKTTGQFQEVSFRSKRSPNQVAFIPKTGVSEKGAFWTRLGKLLSSEKIPKAGHDCRLVLQSGRYYLIVPRKVETASGENQAGVVALDPGLRTFISAYSERGVEKFGQAAFSRIVRLCYALDDLTGRREKASGSRKCRMKKAQQRLRNRVHDSVSELHHKVAVYLTQTFKVVVIPEFNFHPMAGKLFRKTVRGLATLAHGKFRQVLESHAEKRGCRIHYQNEAYTSKTCSSCGWIQEIGAASKWNCKGCGHAHERDDNGARGIFLRALRDNSWIRELVFGSCISGASC